MSGATILYDYGDREITVKLEALPGLIKRIAACCGGHNAVVHFRLYPSGKREACHYITTENGRRKAIPEWTQWLAMDEGDAILWAVKLVAGHAAAAAALDGGAK